MTAELVPARHADDDEPLRALTAQWLTTRQSEHTRIAYRSDLALWLDWCRANGLHPLDARKGDVMEWLAALTAGDPVTGRRPQSGATRARRLGALSSWYRFLIGHEVAQRNPALLEKPERPVVASRRAPALSDDQTERLLVAADADRNPRTAAMVWLLLTTGIRVGELVAADVADIGQDRGVTVLHVRGKGGKTRPVEVEPYTYERIGAYLEVRADIDRLPMPARQVGGSPSRPLIATAAGKRIDRKEVRRVLRRLAVAAGLPAALADRLTPHSTRATFVTTSIEAGVPVRDIQMAAGHASPVTTEGYDRSLWSADRSPARVVAKRFHAARVEALRVEHAG